MGGQHDTRGDSEEPTPAERRASLDYNCMPPLSLPGLRITRLDGWKLGAY
jgi:hypothetical protein